MTITSPDALSASTNAAYRSRAADLFPGGVNSPVRAYRAVGGQPPILVSGRGPRVLDIEGNAFLDYVGAFGPLILGHADQGVLAALHERIGLGGPFGATGPLEVELAETIREAVPSMERLRFVSSGTEAVMSALRVARAATRRPLVLKFAGGYHGHSDGLLADAGSGLTTLGMPASAGVTRQAAAQTLVVGYNDLDAVRGAFEAHAGQIAAVIVEPIAANMGVVRPVPGFLAGLREITARAGAVLVFDEVITGFRVGRGGAQEQAGVRPDLTTLGKIIGGGLPIGAYGGRAYLMELVAPAGPVYQAGTLSGHPLAMAAGLATLSALTESAYAELERAGASLEAGLLGAASAAGRDVSVVRVGSMLTPFFLTAPPRDHGQAVEADTQAFARFFRSMREQGVLLPPSQHEAWFLSTAHTSAEIAATVRAAAVAFRA